MKYLELSPLIIVVERILVLIRITHEYLDVSQELVDYIRFVSSSVVFGVVEILDEIVVKVEIDMLEFQLYCRVSLYHFSTLWVEMSLQIVPGMSFAPPLRIDNHSFAAKRDIIFYECKEVLNTCLFFTSSRFCSLRNSILMRSEVGCISRNRKFSNTRSKAFEVLSTSLLILCKATCN